MVTSTHVLDFKDKEGKRYIFTKQNFDNHAARHQELQIPNFIDRIKKAIIKPDYVYPAFNKKHRFCYYYLEGEVAGTKRYTKVVVDKTKYCYIIVSAYRPTNLREESYGEALCYRP